MRISSLALAIDPNTDKFLVDEVIRGMSSMKNVRQSVTDFDEAMEVAIQILERQISKHSAVDEDTGNESSDEMEVDNSGVTSKVNDVVIKFFPRYGRFKGRVTQINGDDPNGKPIRIVFEDGEVLDFSQQEVDEFSAVTATPDPDW